jgi:hypothetical protein
MPATNLLASMASGASGCCRENAQQASHQRCRPVRTLKSAGEKSVGRSLGRRHAPARQADAAGDDRQHVVEVVRDAARQLADRLHLLHLPHLLLGGVSRGDGVLQGRVGNGQLMRRQPGIDDPVGQPGTGQCECHHDCKREKGNGGTHGCCARVQQHLLCQLHLLEAFAQILHQAPATPFEHQATRALEVALPAQLDGLPCQLQPLGNGCTHVGNRGDLLRIVGNQHGQCVQSVAQPLVDPDERLEKTFVARQDVTALPDFGILQQRPDLRDCGLHLQGVPHQVGLADVPRAEPCRERQDDGQRHGRRLRNALSRCPRSNAADLALDSSHQ